MQKIFSFGWAFGLISLLIGVLACGAAAVPTQATVPVAPITLGSDLTQVDVCQAVPRQDIEAVMGKKLSKAPQHFEYYDTAGSSGCWYEATKDSSGEAHFGYIVFTHLDAYNNQPLYQNKDVGGFGQEAYFNNGADARQLRVKVKEDAAFVVAFGDVPKEDGAKQIAQLLLAAIK
jgi:hypothetical protein